MGFWKNVEERRNYLGITRKDLAQRAGIKYAIIGACLERDSMPAANTALRIAKVLYIDVYKDLEKIPQYTRQTIIEMIHKLAMHKDMGKGL